MTYEEIISFINRLKEMKPLPFFPDTEVIEDDHIYMPAIEFIKDKTTGEWRILF